MRGGKEGEGEGGRVGGRGKEERQLMTQKSQRERHDEMSAPGTGSALAPRELKCKCALEGAICSMASRQLLPTLTASRDATKHKGNSLRANHWRKTTKPGNGNTSLRLPHRGLVNPLTGSPRSSFSLHATPNPCPYLSWAGEPLELPEEPGQQHCCQHCGDGGTEESLPCLLGGQLNEGGTTVKHPKQVSGGIVDNNEAGREEEPARQG